MRYSHTPGNKFNWITLLLLSNVHFVRRELSSKIASSRIANSTYYLITKSS